jgi:hypothetical protein
MPIRTTLNIDDRLGREAKRRAADRGTTLTAVIEQALRQSFEREDAGAPPRLALPTDSGDGLAPGVDLADNAGLRDLMDGLG